MRGLIFEVRRFTVHDGHGIRTTVFMKGCPLKCWWCHNPESQERQPKSKTVQDRVGEKTFSRTVSLGRFYEANELFEEIVRDRIFWEESSGGVSFSGGEPFMQAEFLKEILVLCKNAKIHTTIDTSGYTSLSTLQEIAAYTDHFLYDIKLLDEALHIQYTGVSNRIILENLLALKRMGKMISLRHPVIPGINDSEEEVLKLKKLMNEMSPQVDTLHLLPYHRKASNKYASMNIDNKMKMIAEPLLEEIEKIKIKLEDSGWKVIIGG